MFLGDSEYHARASFFSGDESDVTTTALRSRREAELACQPNVSVSASAGLLQSEEQKVDGRASAQCDLLAGFAIEPSCCCTLMLKAQDPHPFHLL